MARKAHKAKHLIGPVLEISSVITISSGFDSKERKEMFAHTSALQQLHSLLVSIETKCLSEIG